MAESRKPNNSLASVMYARFTPMLHDDGFLGTKLGKELVLGNFFQKSLWDMASLGFAPTAALRHCEERSNLEPTAALRLTVASRRTPALRHCEERSNPGQKAIPLDCFVVPPRNDAKRCSAKRCKRKACYCVTLVNTALSPTATAFTNTAVNGGTGVVVGMATGLMPKPSSLST